MLKLSLIKTAVKYLHLANMAYHLRTQKLTVGAKLPMICLYFFCETLSDLTLN